MTEMTTAPRKRECDHHRVSMYVYWSYPAEAGHFDSRCHSLGLHVWR